MLIIYKRLLGRDLKNLCDEPLFPHAILETVVDEMILLIVTIRGEEVGGLFSHVLIFIFYL